MFSLINEFLDDSEIKTNSTHSKNNFKYVNFNGEVMYFQNFKDIISFSGEEIILKLFCGEASIFGSDLKIREISKRYIALSGKIKGVEVTNA